MKITSCSGRVYYNNTELNNVSSKKFYNNNREKVVCRMILYNIRQKGATPTCKTLRKYEAMTTDIIVEAFCAWMDSLPEDELRSQANMKKRTKFNTFIKEWSWGTHEINMFR